VRKIDYETLKNMLDYDPVTGLFHWRVYRNWQAKPGDRAGTIDSKGHRQIRIFNVAHLAHRLAWLYVHGVMPTDVLDHINGNKDDNRIANLRDVVTAVNCQNELRARANNTCGVLGVTEKRYSFVAQIYANGKKIYLGSFRTAQAAHEAYISAKRELHPGNTL